MHISRDSVFSGYPSFHLYILKGSKKQGFIQSEEALPKESDIIHIMGSGKTQFMNNYERYQKGPNSNTSRNVFHCFIDTLNNSVDSACGGAPQLVGLYRKPETVGIEYGIIYRKEKGKIERRYFLGMEVPKDVSSGSYCNIEWRNENFELCNGETMKRLPDAANQPDYLRRE